MNLQQIAFVLLIALIALGLIILGTLALIHTQSPDVTIMQDSARQCLSQLTGNCIVK